MNEFIEKHAAEADMIINGYAFQRKGERIHVLNLNHPDCAVVLDNAGSVLETSMDDIEIQIVGSYFQRNRRFLEN